MLLILKKKNLSLFYFKFIFLIKKKKKGLGCWHMHMCSNILLVLPGIRFASPPEVSYFIKSTMFCTIVFVVLQMFFCSCRSGSSISLVKWFGMDCDGQWAAASRAREMCGGRGYSGRQDAPHLRPCLQRKAHPQPATNHPHSDCLGNRPVQNIQGGRVYFFTVTSWRLFQCYSII